MISSNAIYNASILIVDDQATTILLLERMLHDTGYRSVTSTMDPTVVCELHRANHFDLILLDLQMPDMDGFQVMEGLKQIEPDGYSPVLVISAQHDNKLRALASGAKDFISKPIDLMEAKVRIYNMLEVRLLYKELGHFSNTQTSLALHDALTGLPNRRFLNDKLSEAVAHANRHKTTMAVMYLDLDGFKQINDQLGHDVGDTLLRAVGARLSAAVRGDDTVVRMGGDEFVVALWKLDNADRAALLAAKIIKALSRPYRIDSQTARVTASVGIALYPAHGKDAETLMKNADSALATAKQSGKNKYCIAGEISFAPATLRRDTADLDKPPATVRVRKARHEPN